MNKSVCRWFSLLICAFIAVSCSDVTQDNAALGVLNENESLLKDAQEYAKASNVSLNEAVTRLEIQDDIGRLDADLSNKLPKIYSGLWIQHVPNFKVIIKTTGDTEAVLAEIENSTLAEIVEVRKASKTLEELSEESRLVSKNARNLGVKVDIGTNIFTNQTEVYTSEDSVYSELERSTLPIFESVKVVKIDSLAKPTVVSNFYGGLRLDGNGCTAGFTTLDKATNAVGMTSAAHCGDYGYWGSGADSVGLTEVRQVESGAYDVQWMRPSSNPDKLKPWVKDDTCSDSTPCYRIVTGVVNRPEQPINAWVCAYGNTTKFRCGYILDKDFAPSYIPNATNTWVRVSRAGVDMSEQGDSGGPWYKGGSAFGINSGEQGDIAIYMAINYIDQSVGVKVATGP